MKISVILHTLVLLFLCSSCATANTTPTFEDRAKEQLTHQKIKIRVDHNKSVLEGDCTMTYLGFNSNKSVQISYSMLYGEIKEVLINGKKNTNYTYQNYQGLSDKLSKQYDLQQLNITIPKEVVSQDKFLVRIIYKDSNFYGTATNPEDNKPFSLGQVTKDNAFSSHINYYPYIQYHGQKADIYISTNLNNAYAISSGSLISQTKKNGFTTFHYHSDNMSGIIPYPFAIGNYEKIETLASNGKTKIRIVFHPEDRIFAKQKLPIIENIFETYESIFGDYPFETLSIVETKLKEGNIGLAGQSLIMLSQKVWFQAELNTSNTNLTNAPLLVLADEINHQWNAYKVNTPNFLAEGISRYVDSLYMETLGGFDVLKKQMKQTQASYFYIIEKQGIEDKPINDPKVYPALYFIKGAAALHMLRSMYGYERFKDAMKYYFDTYHNKVTSLGDFRKSFEHVLKEDLTWFFNQWYKKSGWPKIKYKWAQEDENIKIIVEQLQKKHLYRLDKFPIKITFQDNSTRTEHFNIGTLKNQTIKIEASAKVKSVEFDPDNWFLKQIIRK